MVNMCYSTTWGYLGCVGILPNSGKSNGKRNRQLSRRWAYMGAYRKNLAGCKEMNMNMTKLQLVGVI